jgi:hypothetical protein
MDTGGRGGSHVGVVTVVDGGRADCDSRERLQGQRAILLEACLTCVEQSRDSAHCSAAQGDAETAHSLTRWLCSSHGGIDDVGCCCSSLGIQ